MEEQAEIISDPENLESAILKSSIICCNLQTLQSNTMSNVRYALAEKWRIKNVPGVGAYKVEQSSLDIRPKTPSYSIPRGTSASAFGAILSNASGPGPNAYETSSSFNKTRTLAARTRIGSAPRLIPMGRDVRDGRGKGSVDNFPGPANYELQNVNSCTGNRPISRPRSATIVFPQAQRQTSLVGGGGGASSTTEYIAGPGSYDISVPFIRTRPTTPRTSIGRAARTTDEKSDARRRDGATPAPNAYDTMDASLTRLSGKKIGPRMRIGSAKRTQINGDGSTPGPNAYMVDLSTTWTRPTAPRASIGKGNRVVTTLSALTKTGPADYDTMTCVKSLSSSKTAARAVIGTAGRNGGASDNGWLGGGGNSPGPSAYVGVDRLGRVLKATKANSPAFTMRAR